MNETLLPHPPLELDSPPLIPILTPPAAILRAKARLVGKSTDRFQDRFTQLRCLLGLNPSVLIKLIDLFEQFLSSQTVTSSRRHNIRDVIIACAFSPRLASVTAAARTAAHSSRNGSMIVGMTSRST